PRLGQALRDVITRRRLDKAIDTYSTVHGESDIASALRALERAYAAEAPTMASALLGDDSADIPDEISSWATAAGKSPVDLVRGLKAARLKGSDREWMEALGLRPSTLPIDGPQFFGGSPNVDEVVREILFSVFERLATYPYGKLQRLVTVIETIAGFAEHV